MCSVLLQTLESLKNMFEDRSYRQTRRACRGHSFPVFAYHTTQQHEQRLLVGMDQDGERLRNGVAHYHPSLRNALKSTALTYAVTLYISAQTGF
jgi:hypothetical protein